MIGEGVFSLKSGVSINFHRRGIGVFDLELDPSVSAVEKKFPDEGKDRSSQSPTSIGREDFEAVKIGRFLIPHFQQ